MFAGVLWGCVVHLSGLCCVHVCVSGAGVFGVIVCFCDLLDFVIVGDRVKCVCVCVCVCVCLGV